MPKAVVAVRPLPPEPPAPEVPTPEPRDAEAPPSRAEPAAEPAALAAAPMAEPKPTPQPEPVKVRAAAALEPVPDSGPAPLHAAEAEQEAVIEGSAGAPPEAPAPSEAMADRIDEFERALRGLGEQAPRPIEAERSPVAPPESAAEALPAAAVEPPPSVAPPTPAAVVPAPAPVPVPRPLALPWLTRSSPADTPRVPARPSVAEPADRAVAQPLAVRAPGAAAPPRPRAEVPATAVLRPPQPYRPISTSGRPSRSRDASAGAPVSPSARIPPAAAPATQAVDRGVRPDATRRAPADPVARIAWGDPAEALRALDHGRMLLVRVNDGLEIVGGLERFAGGWRRAEAMPSLGAYSNRVRVVDHVAAFDEPARLCGPGEHLAVVVPIGLERRFESAMRDAATRAGLLWSNVSACYGRLAPTPSGIEFVIDRVEPRAVP